VFLKIIASEQCLPQAGSAATIEIITYRGKGFPAGVSFQSENQMAARSVFDIAQDGGISAQGGQGNEKHAVIVKCRGSLASVHFA
jgi:hypothetical protein